jgi:hypothetical protein
MRFTRHSAILNTVFAACVVAAGGIVAWLHAEPPSAPAKMESPGVAVVELFTSEGCSSCPSAEAALVDVLKASKGKPVYALAFHVDYWDGLGWPDRFATKAYTDRQSRYAAAMRLDNVYTPQVIVNGEREFVGSDRKQLNATIASALATPVEGTIAASLTRTDGDVQLAITATNLPAATIVNAALVKDGLTTEIRRGENRGKTLPHEHVVRAFGSTTLDEHGNATSSLTMPADVRHDHASIVVFAQNAADLKVLAATEVMLPN